jgi:integrase
MLLGPVMPDRVHPHDLAVAGQLNRTGDDADLGPSACGAAGGLGHLACERKQGVGRALAAPSGLPLATLDGVGFQTDITVLIRLAPMPLIARVSSTHECRRHLVNAPCMAASYATRSPGGERKLRDLKAAEVDRWLASRAESLSTSSLRSVYGCLNRSVRRAMARDSVRRNVVELVSVPTGRRGRPSRSLTPQDVDEVLVLSRTASDRLHHYIVLSLLTGARTEELRALRWEHVHIVGQPDTDRPVPPHIEVWRSVREGGDTKTKKSRRTLAVPDRCVEGLRKQWAQQSADRLAAGERWQGTGLVFTTALGSKMDAANVRRDFRRALALVPSLEPLEWTPRELRHSFVSVLSDAGVPVEQISQLVGHSGTTVTELVYRHQLRPILQTGATVMDQLFNHRDESAEPYVASLSLSLSTRGARLRTGRIPLSGWVELRGLEPLTSSMPWWPGVHRRRAASLDEVQ